LAYGAWLDFKDTPQAAEEMYKWAIDIATSASTPSMVDAAGILNINAGNPSANLLSATTALAIHHALNSNISQALPIFLSVLRARRSLTSPSANIKFTPDSEEPRGILRTIMAFATSWIVPPKYPPPPDDGTQPPVRTAKARCEEAAIMSHIGEILYASKSSTTNREDGLAWTREAVDIAEGELRRGSAEKEAKRLCKQCLEVGLGNWSAMVTKLAREEREKRGQSSKASRWLGVGSQEPNQAVGRWESEEQVVKERVRRAREVFGGAIHGAGGSSSFLYA